MEIKIREIKYVEKTYNVDTNKMSLEDKKILERYAETIGIDDKEVIQIVKKYATESNLTEDLEDLDWAFEDTEPVEIVGIDY